MRDFLPKKKPVRGPLSMIDEWRNKKFSSYRIIVENVFSRLCRYWMVLSTKYLLEERNYDLIFRLCVDLNNVLVKMRPVREDDGTDFDKYKNASTELVTIILLNAIERSLSTG